MVFGQPAAFFVALALIPLAAAMFWRRRRPGYVLPMLGGLRNVRPTLRLRLARGLPVLRLVALLLLITALARPRSGDANAIVPAEGIDIAISLDTSSSMTTSELTPGQDRLEASKEVIRNFIKGRENDRIGFVIFAQEALALSPPSLDYDALDEMVEQTNDDMLPDGTGIGVGLASAVNMLQESDAASRVVILLTDGNQNAPSIQPLDAADLASALRIRVYTIGLVEQSGRAGDVDERLLQTIADETGGKFYKASTTSGLAEIYKDIGELETSRVGRERYERYTEYGPWFAIAGASLLSLELLLGATWLRRNPA